MSIILVVKTSTTPSYEIITSPSCIGQLKGSKERFLDVCINNGKHFEVVFIEEVISIELITGS